MSLLTYRLLTIQLILLLIEAASSVQYSKPRQCLRYRENDIFLDTCPAYFQDTVDFSVALFPDPVVLSNLEKSNQIQTAESEQSFSQVSPIPSENKSSQRDSTKPLMSFEEWQKRIKQNESDKDRARFKRKPSAEERQQMVDSVDGGLSDDFGAILEGFIMGTDSNNKKSRNVYAEGEYISPSKSHNGESKDGGDTTTKPFTDVRIKSLKERFNYASIDCAATVRKANPEAKGAQSILYESKDQYLLNSCSADKFVILNLCEQIVVDTIVMANFEFFSSTFKDFRVYASSKYPTNEWKLLGQWQARNTRDLQVFKVPDSGFVEYLKIELLTHYGHEHYCPLSLVRVHGMTNMEYYTIVESQDQDPILENEHLWPTEVREHIIQPKLDVVNVPENFYVIPSIGNHEIDDDVIPPINPAPIPSLNAPDIDLDFLKDTPTLESYGMQKDHADSAVNIHQTDDLHTHIPVVHSYDDNEILESIVPTLSSIAEQYNVVTKLEPSLTLDPSAVSSSLSDFVTSIHSASQSETSIDETTQKEEDTFESSTDPEQNLNATMTTAAPSFVALQKVNAHTGKEGSGTQESIYKTIMKRLTVLEQNMKLSQRFLDDQNKILNGVFVDMEKKHQDQLILLIEHLNETASAKIDHMKRRYEQWYEDLKEQTQNDMKDMSTKINILANQMSAQRFIAVGQFVVTLIAFVYMALSGGTFHTLSPVVAAQQKERKRRESLSSRTKGMLDSLIENRMKKPETEKWLDENKLFLILNNSSKPNTRKESTTPNKKPANPRRHSDSPYHTMGEININLPSVGRQQQQQPTISRASLGSAENKTPLNKSDRIMSRNSSSESVHVSGGDLQSGELYKKLNKIAVEQQRRQESQNPPRKITKTSHSSSENLWSNGSTTSL